MDVVSVSKPSSRSQISVIIRKVITQQRNPTNAVNVGRFCPLSQLSLYIREPILARSPSSAVHVIEPSRQRHISLSTREFIQERDHLMQRADSLERTLMLVLAKTESKRRKRQ